MRILSKDYQVLEGYPYLILELEGLGRVQLNLFGKRTLLEQGIVFLGSRFADKVQATTAEGFVIPGATDDPGIAEAYAFFLYVMAGELIRRHQTSSKT